MTTDWNCQAEVKNPRWESGVNPPLHSFVVQQTAGELLHMTFAHYKIPHTLRVLLVYSQKPAKKTKRGWSYWKSDSPRISNTPKHGRLHSQSGIKTAAAQIILISDNHLKSFMWHTRQDRDHGAGERGEGRLGAALLNVLFYKWLGGPARDRVLASRRCHHRHLSGPDAQAPGEVGGPLLKSQMSDAIHPPFAEEDPARTPGAREAPAPRPEKHQRHDCFALKRRRDDQITLLFLSYPTVFWLFFQYL